MTHVVPAAVSLFALVEIDFAVAEREVGAEWQFALDSRAFRNQRCQATECGELLRSLTRTVNLECVVRRRKCRAIDWVAIATREALFEQLLIVFLSVHHCGAHGVLEETANSVLAPEAKVHFLAGRSVHAWPSAVHGNNPNALINVLGCTHGSLCCRERIWHAEVSEVAVAVVEHRVANLTIFGVAKQIWSVA